MPITEKYIGVEDKPLSTLNITNSIRFNYSRTINESFNFFFREINVLVSTKLNFRGAHPPYLAVQVAVNLCTNVATE